ncbi:MAG: hypothetical protein M3O26_01555 [Pseudomonadota bacterium]|nr:hypothetical protein [Pseudomonadota bacterium]
MSKLVRSVVLFAGAATLVASRVYAGSDSLVVVVANGPLAGTYKAPEQDIICGHEMPPNYHNPGYVVTWRRFTGYAAKELGEAVMEVSNPDKPGVKRVMVDISFGDPDHNPTNYHIFTDAVTFQLGDGGFTMEFDGKTDKGIRLHVTASCSNVAEM